MSVESESREDTPEVPQGAEVAAGPEPNVEASIAADLAPEVDVTEELGGSAKSVDEAVSSEAEVAGSSEGIDEGDDDDQLDGDVDVEPIELIQDGIADEDIKTEWYILKVQVNREESIRAALERKVKIEGLERFFGDIVVPTEDIAEFTKTGKRRIVKKKLYPGYIMVNMAINDDTWFAVRETSGIGDFTGSAGRPAPMDPADVERILKLGADEDDGDQQVKTAIPFNVGDRVRVKDGYFQNFEGDVEGVDEANGRVTVMINIFGRSTPVELEHWQIESV